MMGTGAEAQGSLAEIRAAPLIVKGTRFVLAKMIFSGALNSRFQQDVLQLLHQEQIPPSMFLTIAIQNNIWLCFQIGGTEMQISRVRANILAFPGVTYCSEQELNSPLMRGAIADAMKWLLAGTHRENMNKPSTRTFRGLQ
jgi:hypothetical protein